MWVRGCADEAQVSPQAPQQAGGHSSVLRLPDGQSTYITTCAAINLVCIGLITASISTRPSSWMDRGVGPSPPTPHSGKWYPRC
jgi:hypothetical protein